MIALVLKRAVALLLVAVGLYGAAALAGAALPARTAFIETTGEPGPRIWVAAGPIHTDIVVPMVWGDIDWRPLIGRPAFAADDATLALWQETVPYVAISWGSRDFFRGVPRLRDLRPRHLIKALWDESAVHLTLIERPQTMADAVALDIGAAQYRALSDAIGDSLTGGRKTPRPLPGMGYTEHDGFYASDLRYSLARTCNVWTGDVLAAAGIKVGLWTPGPRGLMWSLKREPTDLGLSRERRRKTDS